MTNNGSTRCCSNTLLINFLEVYVKLLLNGWTFYPGISKVEIGRTDLTVKVIKQRTSLQPEGMSALITEDFQKGWIES